MTTQYATASYQEIIDLHTENDTVSVLGIHTPVSDAPYAFLQGFFDSFQKYHYDGCSLSLVPAARLPADPSQVSYEGGDLQIDPRDLLNPILWHGAHGESLGAVLNGFYAGSTMGTDVTRTYSDSVDHNMISESQIGNSEILQSLYYRALTDNSWKKAHPQQGFRIGGLHPLVYSVGTNMQYGNSFSGLHNPRVPFRSAVPNDPTDGDSFSGAINYAGELGISAVAGSQAVTASPAQGIQSTGVDGSVTVGPDNSGIQFFSERLHRLGWLDTRSRVMNSADAVTVSMSGDPVQDSASMSNLYVQVEDVERINQLPRLFMGVCLLPPAYKAEQYYRLVLNHRFSFKKFRGISMRGDIVGGRFGPGTAPGYTNMLSD